MAVSPRLPAAYLNPQFRISLTVAPPLRQFPRDDFLKGAARQDRSSTSINASARQGWSSTYR